MAAAKNERAIGLAPGQEISTAIPNAACKGGCHCGAVRFDATALPGATRKCNCTYCVRTRFWKVFVAPGTFRMLTGAADTTEYTFGHGMARHVFCRHCGTNLFIRIEVGDAEVNHVVNLACLDEPARAMLLQEPLRYEDGRNDNWWSAPAEVRHL